MTVGERSKAFDIVGDDELDVGVVLLHGFTGTPYEVRYLGDQLARAGYTIRAPLLPGHGTTEDDLDTTVWTDWIEHAMRAVDALRVRCGRVAIVGQSLGGLIALYLASQRRDISAVATLAAPLWLDGLSARVARWTTDEHGPLRRVRAIPKFGGSDVRDERTKAENPCYRSIPTKALGQLLQFMRVADESLPRVTQPTLVLHARNDHTAPVACAPRIAEATRAVRLRILPHSYHLIAVDVERDIVAAEVIAHLRGSITRSPPADDGTRESTEPSEKELPCAT